MPKPLLSDELWKPIEPLLPPDPPKPKGGRLLGQRPQGELLRHTQMRTGPAWSPAPARPGAQGGVRIPGSVLQSAAVALASGVSVPG